MGCCVEVLMCASVSDRAREEAMQGGEDGWMEGRTETLNFKEGLLD